jgi:hypothetical protein
MMLACILCSADCCARIKVAGWVTAWLEGHYRRKVGRFFVTGTQLYTLKMSFLSSSQLAQAVLEAEGQPGSASKHGFALSKRDGHLLPLVPRNERKQDIQELICYAWLCAQHYSVPRGSGSGLQWWSCFEQAPPNWTPPALAR